RLYDKLAGMTGTAMTEAEEFHKIYNLEVVAIPTHRPMIRVDESDLVYKNETGKFNALIDEIEEMTKAGRPVLVGTVSVEKSEVLGTLMKRRGIKHEVLNAKQHEREAGVVAQAGRSGAVTIATNMAGRGTDIKLGGDPAGLASELLHKRGLNPAEVDKATMAAALAEAREVTDADHEKVVAAGGLHIVGTERHDSRRIDNQLRGRAGRQGDPGSSRFYLSLDDDLMKRFASDRVAGLMERLGLDDDTPIESGLVSKTIESAQTRVEGFNFDIRKRVVEFDDVINKQRETIYAERDKVLHNEDLTETVRDFLDAEIEAMADTYASSLSPTEWNLEGMAAALRAMGLESDEASERALDEAATSRETLIGYVRDLVERELDARLAEHGEEIWGQVERFVLLRTIDSLWVEHLTEVDDMRRGIGLRGYAQQDPLNEFRREAYRLYEELSDLIRHQVATTIFRVTVRREPDVQPLPGPSQPSRSVTGGPADSVGESGPAGAQAAPKPAVPAARHPLGPGEAALRRPGYPAGNQAGPIRGLPADPMQGARDAPGDAAAAAGTRQGFTPSGARIGRNDPCWCGSGQKYKKCHGA
ncbi:MAG TPA: SEC-C metal-binding domain-containing protein, partial [Acidimicrobiales bacterium]|nr:SEC-C metal-binding domain-containing protein [Acidimicrobiales bacterium]